MSRDNPISAHERDRWLREDAHRWIRHDVKRFLAPGTDPADVYPALARQRDREDAAFAAQIERGYRLIAAMRKEVASIRADLLRRRLEQTKYSPSQPRVPAGNPRGGQWTDRSGGGAGGGGFGGFGSGDGTGSEDGGGADGSGVEGNGTDDAGTDSENFSDSIVKVAADDTDRRYSPVLAEEEAHGGHTLRDHSGKSDLEIEAEFKRRGYDTPYVSFVPMRRFFRIG